MLKETPETIQTDANVIRHRLKAIEETANEVRDKARELVIQPPAGEQGVKDAAEIKPDTFANELQGALSNIKHILDDALRTLRAFI